jgi:hypothetical protein
MRIQNEAAFPSNPVYGNAQPWVIWGAGTGAAYTTIPGTDTFWTDKPVGTLYIFNRSSGTGYSVTETWQKTGNSSLASDWVCIGGTLTQRISVANFTDGGSTAGTLDLTPQLPVGAFILGSSVRGVVGFAGDTTAVLTIGDGSDVDRYNTSTFNVFSTADIPALVLTQNAPSGNRGHSAAQTVTITVTTSADFTSCKSNGAGRATVSIHYII